MEVKFNPVGFNILSDPQLHAYWISITYAVVQIAAISDGDYHDHDDINNEFWPCLLTQCISFSTLLGKRILEYSTRSNYLVASNVEISEMIIPIKAG